MITNKITQLSKQIKNHMQIWSRNSAYSKHNSEQIKTNIITDMKRIKSELEKHINELEKVLGDSKCLEK